jgi:hypothetical protein
MTEARLPKSSAALVEITPGAPEAMAALGLAPEELAEVEGLSYADLESLGLGAEMAGALAGLTASDDPEPEALDTESDDLAEALDPAAEAEALGLDLDELAELSTAELAELRALANDPGAENGALAAGKPRRATAGRAMVIGGAVIVAGALGWYVWRRRQARKAATEPAPATSASDTPVEVRRPPTMTESYAPPLYMTDNGKE